MDGTLEETPENTNDRLTDLPDACIYQIQGYLDTRSKVAFKKTNLRTSFFCVIPLDEKLVFILNDIIRNIGNNYDMATCREIVSHSLKISYLLNVYINTAIFFQKVKTHTGIVLYVRLMTIDRRNLDVENTKKIVEIFMSSHPIVVSGTNHMKLTRFVDIVNGMPP